MAGVYTGGLNHSVTFTNPDASHVNAIGEAKTAYRAVLHALGLELKALNIKPVAQAKRDVAKSLDKLKAAKKTLTQLGYDVAPEIASVTAAIKNDEPRWAIGRATTCEVPTSKVRSCPSAAAPDLRGRGSRRPDSRRASQRLAPPSERKAQRRPPRAQRALDQRSGRSGKTARSG